MSPNLAASVRARLLNLAKESGRGYNALQLLYFQERFLARLAHSPYRERLVLKGGLFLYGRYGEAARPTQDIDLHGQVLHGDVASVRDAIRAVAEVNLVDDGIRFNPATITATIIQVEADYPGVRVRLEGTLGKAREVLWLDVSFGNVITPAPLDLDFPTLLATDSPKLLASSLETVLAEKLQAATVLGRSNGRAKDFYDLLQASRGSVLDAAELRAAFEATFRWRGTPLADALGLFTLEFSQDAQLQATWERFLRNTGLPAPEDFTEVMEMVRGFLEPVLLNVAQGTWEPRTRHWG